MLNRVWTVLSLGLSARLLSEAGSELTQKTNHGILCLCLRKMARTPTQATYERRQGLLCQPIMIHSVTCCHPKIAGAGLPPSEHRYGRGEWGEVICKNGLNIWIKHLLDHIYLLAHVQSSPNIYNSSFWITRRSLSSWNLDSFQLWPNRSRHQISQYIANMPNIVVVGYTYHLWICCICD